MKALAFSPAAVADLDQIWDYSADRWGLDQADHYIAAILDACTALAQGSKQGLAAEVLPDFQKCFCGAHTVYFLNYPGHLDVIRILHQRQDTQRHL